MTKTTHRSTTKQQPRAAEDALSRPVELERAPARPLPPPEQPRRYFRWLGWLAGLAALAIVAGVAYSTVGSDDEVAPLTESPTVTAALSTRMPVEIPPVPAALSTRMPVEIPPVSAPALLPYSALPDMPTGQPWPLPGPSLGPWALESHEMAFILEAQPGAFPGTVDSADR